MRNLGLVVAIWLAAILPTNSLALGLGEIEVKSFLNQPLDAEIQVISARPGEIDDLLVSLASREAFSRAGLARPRHLSDLRFSVEKNEAGDEAVIHVTTKAGVKEPFLNFLIEADWSKGRVLREFTILLDPPFYADQPPPVETVASTKATPEEEASVSELVEQAGLTSTQAPESGDSAGSGQQVSEPIALSDGGGTSEPEPLPLPEPEPEPVAAPEPVNDPYAAQSTQDIAYGDVSVVKGDTLWSIAGNYKDDAHSMSQVMLAFQRANPDAFVDGNINRMKAGAILRAPSRDDLDALSQQEAYAEVLVQNGLWDEYVARVTGTSPSTAFEQTAAMDSTGGDSAGSSGESSSSELSLLMPDDGSGESTGTGDSGEVEDLRTKLALAEEELEASRIENRELESRIAELQARLSKVEELQKMVEIEDDSLSALQQQQSDTAVEQPVIEETLDSGVDTALSGQVEGADQSSDQALLEELLAEEAAAQAEEQAALQASSGDEMVSDEVAEAGQAANDGMASDESTGGDTLTEENAEPVAQAQQVTPPAPVIVTEPVSREPSIFDGILPRSVIDMIPSMPSMGGLFGDPIVLAGLGGVVVLLLGLLLVRRKKKATESDSGVKAASDEDLFAGDDDEELTPIHLEESETPEDTDIKIPTEEDLSLPGTPPEQQTLTSTSEMSAVPDDDLAATAIISAVDMPEPEAPSAAASEEQDDVLNEVDVYLAYGLYDNAEELLNSSITENPERADYRSKLLDTYFATKNAGAFVKEAENLRSMGDVASRYWDRVQVMGYELAPDNPLFSEAKDSDMSAADLEISRPQEADFDLGAGEDDTNFSTTDFNLGEEDTGGDFDETSNLSAGDANAPTQVISPIDELPELSDEDDTDLNKQSAAAGDDDGLPEDIGAELEFSMDEEETVEPGALADDDLGMDFDLDDVGDDDDASSFDLGDDLEAALGDDDDAADLDDAVELDLPDDEEETFLEATAVIDPDDFEATAVVPGLAMDDDDDGLGDVDLADIDFGDDDDEADDDDQGIDLGMDDTGIMDVSDVALETGELQIAADDDAAVDDEDISILDFGAEDFEEPTALVESDDDLAAALDMDLDDDEESRTGTFAPGDFEEPTAVVASGDLDDIDDLMLPDDVDEVSTKLDLARAFIDMGDTEGARGSLEEVIAEGNEAQKEEAQALLNQI